MPMLKTRPGAERLAYQEVRRERLSARRAERLHLRECPRCGNKDTDVYQRCEYGWRLAKRRHAAEYRYGRFVEETVNGQGVLF